MAKFKSTHNLPFEIAPCENFLKHEIPFYEFKVGTCKGLCRFHGGSYEILSIINNQLGNGHFQDVIDWFENSCKRDSASLKFLHPANERFRTHLIKKRGF